MAANKVCPKCKGKLRWDNEEKEFVCLTCGYRRRSSLSKHKFYELNKKEILADFNTLGVSGMRKKWGIPNSSWVQLRERWGVGIEAEQPLQAVSTPNGKAPQLPEFPPFSDNWVPEVQLKWLDIWANLQPFGRLAKRLEHTH
jgi:DNA-directed RNA polymerase subunit RPC12/RpoP